MFFSLTQILADLSQHLTFEPGDVILTGTPAGSSVVNPGDTIEVEVDAPTAPGAPTSGRLTTTVINGTDPTLGSLPTITDQQREEAWGSRHAAGLPPHELSDELRTKLEKTPVAALSQQLRKRGLNNTTIDGVHPLHPDKKIVGTAKTLRFVPGREDLFTAHGGGYNAQKRCFDSVTEGEVIIIEARGETGSGTLGDILAIRAHANKCAGIITDGGVRDHDAVKAVGIPVYTAGPHPAVLGRKHVPWETDVAVACGGTTILPGDIIVADADGVIVIPHTWPTTSPTQPWSKKTSTPGSPTKLPKATASKAYSP